MENPLHCYIQLTPEFAAQHEGYKNENNIFVTATTKDGRIVISANALNEFPELFIERSRVTTLYLSPNDFDIPSFESQINK